MSTILKALRRLEEDSTTLPATHPGAADELRDRILAEEAASEAISASTADALQSSRSRLLRKLALAATVAVGLALVLYYIIPSDRPEDPQIAANPTAPAPEPRAAATATRAPAVLPSPLPSQTATQDTRNEEETVGSEAASGSAFAFAAGSVAASAADSSDTSSVNLPSSSPTQSPNMRTQTEPTTVASASSPAPDPGPSAAPITRAAVTPTQASLDATSNPTPAKAKPPSIARRPKPTIEERSPASVAASRPPGDQETAALPRRPTPSTPTHSSDSPPMKARTKRPAEAPSVDRIDQPSLPDLTVVRTAWHPEAGRRSAKIRLEETKETLTLREGDAVGGLVIDKISPSSVLFKAGDVEVRRRVGQGSSGG
jgi:hypothetical protein